MKRSKIILGILILSVMALVLSGCGEGNLVTLPPLEKITYALRDIGPAGGYIFYDKGSSPDGWRYLEAAPVSTEWTGKQWGSYWTWIGGTGTGIGTGQSNTTIIVTWLNNNSADYFCDVTYRTDRAAYLCDAWIYGGYSDWFLPSRDELNKMWVNLKSGIDENGAHYDPVGGFADNYCWSSSEGNVGEAWSQDFKYGYQGRYYKGLTSWVRAVRAF